MKADDALNVLQRTLSYAGARQAEMELVIPVVSQGGVGGSACVKVKSIHAGIDWDANRIFVYPEADLTSLSPEQVAEIGDSVRKGQSWHAYQTYKAQKEKLQAMQQEIEKKNGALLCAVEAVSWAMGHIQDSKLLEDHLETIKKSITS